MPSIQVTGQLVDPTTGVEGSADIRIASLINYGQTTKKSISHESTDASGNYDFQLVHGKHLIFVKYEDERIYIPIGYAVVGDSTPDPIDLIQLINLSDENPPSELVTELQQLREDTLNDIVDTSAQVLENAGYQGKWVSGTSTALKGETWQVSGRYYVALKNTSVDPINDDDNWREVVSIENLIETQVEIVGGIISPQSGVISVGSQISTESDYVRHSKGGLTSIYKLNPKLSGQVDVISENYEYTELTIDGQTCYLTPFREQERDNNLTDSFTPKVGTNKSGRLPVVNIVGDSISFGVGVGSGVSVEDHAYAGIMRKLLNLELGSTNLGFTPIVPSNEKKIHEFTRIPSSGAWTAIEKENATHVVNGLSYSSSTIGSQIKITVPTINRTCSVWYTAQPGGGTFTVTVNGILERTVDSSGGGSVSTKQGFFFEKGIPMTDDGYGKCEIVIEVVSGPVEIVGIDYRDSVDAFRVNNFSQPGRKARDLSPEVISEITKVGSTLVFALGYNDLNSTGSDLDSAVANIKAVADSCIARDVKLFILDTGWNYPSSNPIREAWRLMNARVKNSVLLNFAEFFLPSGDVQTASYLQSTIGFLSDGSHPSVSGHKNIAEALASAMNLGYSSKRQSIQFNQKWNPVDILPSSGFKNRFSQPLGSTDESSRYVAAWRRNGNSIQIKAWLRHDSTIPIDTWIDLFEIPDNDVTIPFSTQSAILERASGSVPDSTKIGYLRVGSGTSPMVSIKVPTGYTGNTDVVFMTEVPLNFWDDFENYK